jgi:hypothetical protein
MALDEEHGAIIMYVSQHVYAADTLQNSTYNYMYILY